MIFLESDNEEEKQSNQLRKPKKVVKARGSDCTICNQVFGHPEKYEDSKLSSDHKVGNSLKDNLSEDKELNKVHEKSQKDLKKDQRKARNTGIIASLVLSQWTFSFGFWLSATLIPSILNQATLFSFYPSVFLIISFFVVLSKFPYLPYNVIILPYAVKVVRRRDGFARWFITPDAGLHARKRVEEEMRKQEQKLLAG